MSALQNGPRTSSRKVVKVTPVEVKAARLNLELNQRRGNSTPRWIERVANASKSR